jgi:hypothetical protein
MRRIKNGVYYGDLIHIRWMYIKSPRTALGKSHPAAFNHSSNDKLKILA